EIAVRAFRAAVELGAQTVAVFPWEDRNSLHRLKADQSFQIGETGHPVRAYLSVEEILTAARTAGADAVYPGDGFLAQNTGLAEGCARAGIPFVGPPADILRLAGTRPGRSPRPAPRGCQCWPPASRALTRRSWSRRPVPWSSRCSSRPWPGEEDAV